MNDQADTEITRIENYHYEKDGSIFGPISKEKLFELVRRDELSHQNLIWKDGEIEWSTIGKVFKLGEPPSLPLTHISNGYVVALTLAPLSLNKIINLTFEPYKDFFQNHLTLLSWLVFLLIFLINNIFLFADIFKLEKQGIKLGKYIMLWGNLIPTYLYYRGTVICRHTQTKFHISHFLALVWIVTYLHFMNVIKLY